MKNLIWILFLLLITTACGVNSDSVKPVDDIKTRTELNAVLKTDRLNYEGKITGTSLIDKVFPYKDSSLILISFGEKTIYFTDLHLNASKRIDLRAKYGAQLPAQIYNAFLNKDTLFFADNSYSIKKLNLISGEFKEIPLNGMIYFSKPYYLSFSRNGDLVYTFNCFTNTVKNKIKEGDYIGGAIFKPDGNLKKQLALTSDLFDHDVIGKDIPFYSEFGSRKYIYFEMCRNVLILDSLDNRIALKSFYVNKDWTKPVFQDGQVSSWVVNNQPMVEYKDRLIQWPPPGNYEKRGRVVIYDMNMNPLKVVYLNGLEKSAFYTYTVSGNTLIVFSENRNGDSNLYEFDLSKI